jgi:predicted unusual protein kinase regulating ubiquinone biosynthesis (AarF/ABC1/UbiB family)
VAVKVRRPGILKLFLADLQVVDWLAQLAEFMTLLRPGFTKNLRAELRETLLEELDFRREARFQDTFRRNAPKSGRDFFTAARVYFDLSGEEVLVQEFVAGLWLWEVIACNERNDAHSRELLRQHNIDPLVVARRIMWAAFWSMDEHVFFHADPHPANILVRDNNELTFIDFGSCGSFNIQQKMALEQMVLSMERQDAEGMTLATFKLMEPLPPVDVPALSKKLQEGYLRLMHTFNTPAEYTEAWERTSARQWLVLVQVARQFSLPLNLHMLRMIRATLLYDSIVVRLDSEFNRHAQYMDFMKDRAALIKKKWRRDLRENAGDAVFLRIEELNDSLNDILLRAQTTLSRPIVEFGSTVDKWVFALSVIGRMAGRVLLVTVLAVAGLYAYRELNGLPISPSGLLFDVSLSWPYQLFLAVTAALNLRHILFRLRERDERSQRRRE